MSEPGYTATSESTVIDTLRRAVAAWGDEVALRTAGGWPSRTWNQHTERVAVIAGGLAGPGDTVALGLTNWPEFQFVGTAVQHLGAAPFSCYHSSSPEQLGYLLRASDARVAGTERLLAPAIAGKLADPESPLRLLAMAGDGEGGGGSSAPPAEKTSDGEDGGGSSAPPAEKTSDGEDGGGSSAPPAEKTSDGEDGGGSSAPPAEKTSDGEDGGGSSAPPAREPGKTSDGEDGGGSSAPPAG